MTPLALVLLAAALLTLLAALIAFAALLAARRADAQWHKCPECNWYHSGYTYELENPVPGKSAVPIRRCSCCEAIRRIETQKQFTRSMR